jgi:glutaconyl-CoA/methylmalonyl-CoA decarboxylase subunit gamma
MNIHVKIGAQTFEVEVGDLSSRPILVKVDCDTFEVWPEAEALPGLPVVEQPGQVSPPRSAPTPAAIDAHVDHKRVVTAPIPGSIISVAVVPGDKVSPGQELCVLEAMKMKNAIRATRAGVIAAVLVNTGDHAQKGQPLIEYTD